MDEQLPDDILPLSRPPKSKGAKRPGSTKDVIPYSVDSTAPASVPFDEMSTPRPGSGRTEMDTGPCDRTGELLDSMEANVNEIRATTNEEINLPTASGEVGEDRRSRGEDQFGGDLPPPLLPEDVSSPRWFKVALWGILLTVVSLFLIWLWNVTKGDDDVTPKKHAAASKTNGGEGGKGNGGKASRTIKKDVDANREEGGLPYPPEGLYGAELREWKQNLYQSSIKPPRE